MATPTIIEGKKEISMTEKSFEYEKKCFINGVRYILEKEGMLQSDIAKAVGVTQQHISYIMTGKKTGSAGLRFKIAQFLGYSYDDLVRLGQAVLQNKVDIIKDITGRVKILSGGSQNSANQTNRVDIRPIVNVFPYFREYLNFALTCADSEVAENQRKENIIYAMEQFLRHAKSHTVSVAEGNGRLEIWDSNTKSETGDGEKEPLPTDNQKKTNKL